MVKMNFESNKRGRHPNWRDYQEQLRHSRRGFKRHWVILTSLLLVTLYTLYAGLGTSAVPPQDNSSIAALKSKTPRALISKQDIQLLLANLPLHQILAPQIRVPISSRFVNINTSLDLDLQDYLIKKMDRRNSSLIGIAVMQANTGRILALAGFSKANPEDNPCLRSSFPAASIFKIVTAAAAVDHCKIKADSIMHFNGYKHTLYKNQLKNYVNRYTNAISFKNAFAQSINPVFGKLGILELGKTVLEEYATAFGFNQPIEFELPLDTSHLQIEPTAYHWAEIASGFNRDTTLSPIHAAMMASAVVNEGRMVNPTMVDRVMDETGDLLYQSSPEWPRRAMTTKAAEILSDLMETTIRSGTGRKTFRDRRRHKVLTRLNIGGKTGSIYNRTHDARFDWFAGYAQEKQGPGQLAIAVMVAHEEYIGTRAIEYARMAITHYFKALMAQRDATQKDIGG